MSLKAVLTSADTLLGLSRTPAAPPSLTAPKPSLASLLAARLEAYAQQTPLAPTPALAKPLDTLSERTLQRLTATAALDLLQHLASLTPPSSTPSSASSSSSAAQLAPPPPPAFGARDIKAFGMLAGVVGRWGIQPDLVEGVLPPLSSSSARQPKIAELVQDDEDDELSAEKKQERLAETVKKVLVVLGLDEPGRARTDGQKQLVGVVLPQLLVPLVGALVQLARAGQAWAGQGLEAVFRSNPPTVVLSTLLSLLASTRSPSFRSYLAYLLSSQLLRPGGVRSLLIVVVGTGGAAGTGEDEVGMKKLEMLRKLLSASPGPGRDEKTYFSNLTQQLLDILRSAASTSVSTTLASSAASSAALKGKSPAVQQQPASGPTSIVPAPILRAATYVLAHYVVASEDPAEGAEDDGASTTSTAATAAEAVLARAARPVVLAALQGPLLPSAYPPSLPPPQQASSLLLDEDDDLPPVPVLPPRKLYDHLTLLSLFTLYAPPLPSVLLTLLSPLVAPLLALLSHLDQPPLIVSSPTVEGEKTKQGVEDEAKALLGTLVKAGGSAEEVVKAVGRAVETWEAGEEFGAPSSGVDGRGGTDETSLRRFGWTWDDNGAPSLSLLRSPPSLPFSSANTDPNEPSLEDLNLPVSAPTVVLWLKDVGRKEVNAGLFLRWLDEVRVLQGVGREGGGGAEVAKRSLTRLTLILQMLEHLHQPSTSSPGGEQDAGGGGSDLLTQPTEIIAFVAHALEAADPALSGSAGGKGAVGTAKKREKREEGKREGLAGLRIVEEDEAAPEDVKMGDEDEEGGLGTGLGKDEMAMTALTLLLAVLEANPDLSESTTPLLRIIASQLTVLAASSSSPVVAPLAREARMVLSLRRAESTLSPSSADDGTNHGEQKDDPLAASRATYREALKLLQDPLLPVRAQGLHLLRTLVLDRQTALLKTDSALLPAVLDVFAQAVEEEDSFLYLNAVQGLSSLVDVFGRQVVGRLVEDYVGARRDEGRVRDVGTGERGRRELDKRLRVGEAIVQVVQRAGEALAVLTDDLLPPLLLLLRTPTLPIPLRASALTILATCVETAPAAMAPHAELLTEACTTLLSVESVPLAPKPRAAVLEEKKPEGEPKKESKGKGVLIEEVSSDDSDLAHDDDSPPSPALDRNGRPKRPEELPDPTTSSSRHPTLRRAALVFLGALVRTMSAQAAERDERAQSAALDGSIAGAGGLLGGRLRLPGQASSSSFLVREHKPAAGLGALVGPEQLVRARRVLRYVSETDEDGLVRHQAGEVLRELEE
ncbi:hypothetical protein JCM8097_001649 [Rhodosporidiobolus ruineniae]